ncbi:hypothetical protein IH981_00785 [Patescibacteria group bacterium]|nr:hypothetical protein [Patescibacteria group bacterium]
MSPKVAINTGSRITNIIVCIESLNHGMVSLLIECNQSQYNKNLLTTKVTRKPIGFG